MTVDESVSELRCATVSRGQRCGAPLLRRASRREGAANRTLAPVYRFVYSRTGNRPDAEDVTSQIFLQAMPFLRRAGPEETRAYLFATARTELAKHWRDRYGVSQQHG